LGGYWGGWGQRGEMIQALYAHMNNKTIKIKKKGRIIAYTYYVGNAESSSEAVRFLS
jgi:hypothetical protein